MPRRSKTAIANMILAGKLTSGPKVDGRTTVDEADVATYQPHVPPDNEHVWLTSSEAARLVGISKQAMNHRCATEKVPSTLYDGRRWIRRDQLEMIERARAVTQGEAPPA